MRSENLITVQPVFRMRSRINPEFLVEVFEWVDEQAFDRAQKSTELLGVWGKYQNIWVDGGFGMNHVPEANQPWAQYSSIDS